MKKYLIIALIFTMLLPLGATASAARAEMGKTPPEKRGAIAKKQEIEEMQKNFDGLSDTQKEELYNLASQITDQTKELMTKYGEYGVISKERAETMNAMLTKMFGQAKEDGKVIFGGPPPCCSAA